VFLWTSREFAGVLNRSASVNIDTLLATNGHLSVNTLTSASTRLSNLSGNVDAERFANADWIT